MFCGECGNQLTETSKFCTKCGNKVEKSEWKNEEKDRNKSEVVFEVRSTFKFVYAALPTLLGKIIPFIFMIGVGILMCFLSVKGIEAKPNDASSLQNIILILEVIVFILIPLIVIGEATAQAILGKKEYQNRAYIFYNDRVVYKDNFLNVYEEEVKYSDIREITKAQTIAQRYFNIGNIELHSSAEHGGILLRDIADVESVYKRIKEIINV